MLEPSPYAACEEMAQLAPNATPQRMRSVAIKRYVTRARLRVVPWALDLKATGAAKLGMLSAAMDLCARKIRC